MSGSRRHRGYRPIKGQGSVQAGLYWAHEATALSLGLAIPAVLGYFLDEWLGWAPVCTVTGALLGFALLMIRLIQMVTPDTAPPSSLQPLPDDAGKADDADDTDDADRSFEAGDTPPAGTDR